MLSEKPVDKTLFDWLNMLVYDHPKDGIETQLNDPNSKNSFQVIIPFKMMLLRELQNAYQTMDLSLLKEYVKEAQNFC